MKLNIVYSYNIDFNVSFILKQYFIQMFNRIELFIKSMFDTHTNVGTKYQCIYSIIYNHVCFR